ncbi:phosphoribosylanthranilate isomerase [Algoriphagus namhaensis]|uniref:N-(5'-phosphoribosyl)anthranilate isomerase n=1 Tax=Algoriphagus namhaensis TaxID=915353 RepID=A0ABV8ALF0_9BACT
MEIKVCGMREISNMQDLILQVSPDWMGLIFYSKSPRFVKDELKGEVKKIQVPKVGVFVNESIDYVLDKVQKYDLAAIQLHGKESVGFVAELKNQTTAEIWKVVSVGEDLNWEELKAYVGQIDRFLFDTATNTHGGSGKKFDWGLLDSYPFQVPFMLSGGIDLESVKRVKDLKKACPQLIGVDLNSKFETEPGIKDVAMLRNFKEELLGLRSVN